MKVYVCLALVFMGACDVPPPEQEKSREQTWTESKAALEPEQGQTMTPVEGDLERRTQKIGWYGGTYTWGRCNLTGWPACGGAGKIAFYRNLNQTGEGIQLWTTGGNHDVWMDLDYYTWNDGVAVDGLSGSTTKSWFMWPHRSDWVQKAWICQYQGCETAGNPDNALAYYNYVGVPPYGTGNGNIWGVSAFWLMNHY
jgi:hypothetical protein